MHLHRKNLQYKCCMCREQTVYCQLEGLLLAFPFHSPTFPSVCFARSRLPLELRDSPIIGSTRARRLCSPTVQHDTAGGHIVLVATEGEARAAEVEESAEDRAERVRPSHVSRSLFPHM